MSNSTEMVELVARAIYAARAARLVPPYWKYDPPLPWEEENEPFRENVRAEARAAIEAMREPVPSMRLAALDAATKVNRGRSEVHIKSGALDGLSVYRAMISAALSPEDEGSQRK